MCRKKSVLIFFIGFLSFLLFFSAMNVLSQNDIYMDKDEIEQKIETPQLAASLEGSENILITKIRRDANLSGYGLVNIRDEIKLRNLNNNPLTGMYIGVPLNNSDDLIFYEATDDSKATLSVERTDLALDDYEMIIIHFNTPLRPQETKQIFFKQSYKNMLQFFRTTEGQKILHEGIIYPILPYRANKDIVAQYQVPESSTVDDGGWGSSGGSLVTYNFKELGLEYMEPLFENMEEEDYHVNLIFSDDQVSKLEFDEIERDIYISPWGIIQVKEEFLIHNKGGVNINLLNFEIPGPAVQVNVYDDLGEVLGITLNPEENYTKLEYKSLEIDLSENRVQITPGSKFRFIIEYFLPFEKHFTLDWFRESINLNIFPSKCQYLGLEQTVRIHIEGCSYVESITDEPDAIEFDQGATVLVYNNDYITPFEQKKVQFTFVINFFDMLIRPVGFMLLIAIIASAYVILIKSRKSEEEKYFVKEEVVPVNEIRQFCSLYEEKNALTLEIRQAEEDAKNKKIPKKRLKSLINKNRTKIEEINEEITPFQKKLRKESPTYENIIKKLEILEAERVSVRDSLRLLETRYRRGRLPSKAAYTRLSNNFLRRQRKVDRTIDKLIQQLRSYLL